MRLSAETHHLLEKRFRAALQPLEIVACCLLATTIFVVVFISSVFGIRYRNHGLAQALIIACGVVAAGTLLVTAMRWRSGRPYRAWLALAINAFLALAIARYVGDRYWYENMIGFYTLQEDMANYINVDPAADRGQSFMDAGTIYFKEGSYVLRGKSIAFHNGLTYCVAPIVRAPVRTMSKTGVVKNWNDDKGFGFIGPDDGGDDVFCHSSSLSGGAKGLGKGDRVRFSTEFDDRKGKMRACDVSVEGGGGGGGGGGGRRDSGRDDRYGGRDDRDRYGGGRDDRYGGSGRNGREDRDRYSDRGRDDRYGGGGRDDRYGGRDGGRDDRYSSRGGGGGGDRNGGDRYGGGGGGDRDRDRASGGGGGGGGGGGRGGTERFGGDTRGDDISSGGREHLTARELYMRREREKASDRRSPSESRSRSPPKRLKRDANFA